MDNKSIKYLALGSGVLIAYSIIRVIKDYYTEQDDLYQSQEVSKNNTDTNNTQPLPNNNNTNKTLDISDAEDTNKDYFYTMLNVYSGQSNKNDLNNKLHPKSSQSNKNDLNNKLHPKSSAHNNNNNDNFSTSSCNNNNDSFSTGSNFYPPRTDLLPSKIVGDDKNILDGSNNFEDELQNSISLKRMNDFNDNKSFFSKTDKDSSFSCNNGLDALKRLTLIKKRANHRQNN